MKNLNGMMAVVALMVITAAARAEAPATTRAVDDQHWPAVARYVDDQTLMVGHLDVGKVDLAALEKFVDRVMDAGKVPAEARQGLAGSKGWTMLAGYKAHFEKLGGRQVYLLIAHPDAWPGMQPIAVLLPLEKGGDAQGMVDFLNGALEGDFVVSKLNEDLVYVGEALPLKRFGTMKAVMRADLEAGLAASAGGALQVVAAPTADVRRAVAELLPRLPAEIAGDPLDASTEFLTKGLNAVRLKVEMPPGVRVRLSFEMAKQEDAVKVAALVGRVLEMVKGEKDFAEMKDFVGSLKPERGTEGTGEGTRHFVAITLDERGLLAAAGEVIMPAVEKRRATAMRTASAKNMMGVMAACWNYASKNKDEWPESLDVLVKEGLCAEQMLVNPSDPKHRRYEYHRWTKEQVKKLDWSSTPVLWEVVDDENAGLNVGYLDDHVDYVASRKQLEESLKKAEETAGKK